MGNPHIARHWVGRSWQWGVWSSREIYNKRTKPVYHSKDLRAAIRNVEVINKMKIKKE